MRSRCPRLDIDFDCAYRLDISRLCSRSKDPSAVSCCRFGRKLLATGDVNGTILSNGTFAAGWELKYNGSTNIQNLTQGGVNQNQALCTELPSAGVSTVLHLPSTIANVLMRAHTCSASLVDIVIWQMCALKFR